MHKDGMEQISCNFVFVEYQLLFIQKITVGDNRILKAGNDMASYFDKISLTNIITTRAVFQKR